MCTYRIKASSDINSNGCFAHEHKLPISIIGRPRNNKARRSVYAVLFGDAVDCVSAAADLPLLSHGLGCARVVHRNARVGLLTEHCSHGAAVRPVHLYTDIRASTTWRMTSSFIHDFIKRQQQVFLKHV